MCYAHEDRNLAEEIAQALTNDGHDVFIDAAKLQVSGDFNEEIRRAIDAADRFIFLISRSSMAQGKYPQTELGFAQARWPSPEGAVWPVLVDGAMDVKQLPIYLRSVQIHRVKGNAPAEIAEQIERSRFVRPRYLAMGAAVIVATIGAAGGWLAAARDIGAYELAPAVQVDFRPSKKPGADATWENSWLALTLMPVQYANHGSGQVRIMDETVRLKLGGRDISFKGYNEVELKPVCPENDFLCTKGPLGIQPLKPRDVVRRETMYAPGHGEKLSWREFVDQACGSADDVLEIELTSRVDGVGIFGTATRPLTTVCRVDLKNLRELLLGCGKPRQQMISRASPDCLPEPKKSGQAAVASGR